MLGHRKVSGVIFADDLVLLADNPQVLQAGLIVLQEYILLKMGPYSQPQQNQSFDFWYLQFTKYLCVVIQWDSIGAGFLISIFGYHLL